VKQENHIKDSSSRKYILNKGFTLIELLVVIGVLAVILAITLIAINPAKQFQDASNTRRSNDVKAILDAVWQYGVANSGKLDALNIPVTPGNSPQIIGSNTGNGEVNLCDDLVPSYIARMPVDPISGNSDIANDGISCADYVTGYTIIESSDGHITVSAPDAEAGETIAVTR